MTFVNPIENIDPSITASQDLSNRQSLAELAQNIILLIDELSKVTFEDSFCSQIARIENKISQLKAGESAGESVKAIERSFQEVVGCRKKAQLSRRFEACVQQQEFLSAFHLMDDHPEWVEDNIEIACDLINSVTEIEILKFANRTWDDCTPAPKSLGDLVVCLFRNHPILMEKTQKMTLIVGEKHFPCNEIVFWSHFATFFEMGIGQYAELPKQIELSCNSESVADILTFLISRNILNLLVRFEDNFITANLYGINAVVLAMRHHVAFMRTNLPKTQWEQLVVTWQADPTLEPLLMDQKDIVKNITKHDPDIVREETVVKVPPNDVFAVPVLDYQVEHEDRIQISMKLLNDFIFRITNGRTENDTYLSLNGVKKAVDLLLRMTSTGQIGDNSARYEQYLSLITKSTELRQILCVNDRNEDLLAFQFDHFYEEELLMPFHQTTVLLKNIFLSMISAYNILNSQIPQEVAEHPAWHGTSLKIALLNIGLVNKASSQKMIIDFVTTALMKAYVRFDTCYIILRPSSTSTPPDGKKGIIITVSYWDPRRISADLSKTCVEHTRITAVCEGEKWTYTSCLFGHPVEYDSLHALIAGQFGIYFDKIEYVPAPGSLQEIQKRYVG